ncbi:MAG: hypothetical protein WCG27_06350 [Pseudomonadota bacterium]
MKLMRIFLILLALAIFSLSADLWADQLAIVKSISSSHKSFVINKGRNDGVRSKQRRAFTSDKISVVAEATEVSPDNSLWQVYDKNATIPFRREEIIFMTTTTESLWTAIMTADYREKEAKRSVYLYYLRGSSWLLRAAYARTFINTTSQTPADQNYNRAGYHFEGLYDQRIKDTQVNYGVGFRFDRDREVLEDIGVTTEIRRYFLIGDLTYHIERMKSMERNWFASFGLGMGRSDTVMIDTQIKAGNCFALPVLRFGLQNHISQNYFLMVEATLESIYVRETFVAGPAQTNNVINAKLGMALRF